MKQKKDSNKQTRLLLYHLSYHISPFLQFVKNVLKLQIRGYNILVRALTKKEEENEIFCNFFPLKKFSHSMNHLNQFQKNKTF